MADGVKKGITHSDLITWVNEADDSSASARLLSEKARDYYDSKQWTAAEVSTLSKRGQAATVINRIKPKVDALLGMEKSAKTTAKAFPRTPKHSQAADAASESIRFVMDDNQFDEVRSSVWEFILVEGTGGCDIVVKPQGKDFKIEINSIFWDRILSDPHSRRKDFTDARYLGQVVWADYDEALSRYPKGSAVLEDMLAGSTTYDDKPHWMDTTRRRVKLVELYYREDGDWKYAVFTRGGFLKEPIISPYVNEEGETEHAYEFASAFVEREGYRYGAVRQLLDVQDEVNKRRSKALHLMSVRQVLADRGAVEDVNRARQELAKPDGFIEAVPEMRFEVLKTGDMAAAQFDLLTEAKQEIDAVGVNASLTGKDTRVVSGIALQERKLAGQTELGPLFDVLRHWQLRVFRKVWNRVRQYWKEEKWVRVTDDDQNLRWVGLNRPITKGEQMLQQAKQQGAPPEMLQQLQAQIASDPMMQEVVSTENDIATLDIDLILQEIPDTVSTQVEEFQALAEMIKSGIPIPPLAIIEASQLPHKDKILKMMKEQPQVPPQMQEQIQRMQEEGQKLVQENQQLRMDQQEGIAKVQASQQEASAKLALRREEIAGELALQKQKQDGELQLAREKAEAEIALRRSIARADFEIEQMKLQASNVNETRRLDFDTQLEAKRDGAKAQSENEAKANDLNPKILDALNKVVETAAEAKTKHIAITMPDGKKATAVVTVH